MASTDAKPVPQKNVAYRVTFPIIDADGDLVTGATGLDSEVSKDGGTFADCTNEATEIATNSGVYFLDLTSTEMNADTVAVIVKTSSSGAKTTVIVMYPEEAGDIRVNVTQFGSTNGTFSSGRPEVNTTHIAGSSVSTSSAQIGVNVVNFGGSAGTFASGRPEVNTSHIAGSSVSTTSAQIGVNVVQISTDATAADNLEAMLDGTGGVTLTTAIAGNITGNLSGSVGSVTGAVGSLTTNNDKTGYRLSATGVDDIHDEAVDGSTTLRESVRLQNSAAAGKLSGAGTTTVVVRDLADSKDRITATVDADGNRTAVSRNVT